MTEPGVIHQWREAARRWSRRRAAACCNGLLGGSFLAATPIASFADSGISNLQAPLENGPKHDGIGTVHVKCAQVGAGRGVDVGVGTSEAQGSRDQETVVLIQGEPPRGFMTASCLPGSRSRKAAMTRGASSASNLEKLAFR